MFTDKDFTSTKSNMKMGNHGVCLSTALQLSLAVKFKPGQRL